MDADAVLIRGTGFCGNLNKPGRSTKYHPNNDEGNDTNIFSGFFRKWYFPLPFYRR